MEGEHARAAAPGSENSIRIRNAGGTNSSVLYLTVVSALRSLDMGSTVGAN